MPRFDTPGPISVTAEFMVGTLHIIAGERTDTVVEVRPVDGTVAKQTRVEYGGGRLLIKAPKGRRQNGIRGGGQAIDIVVELPAGSDLRANVGKADVQSTGRIGACWVQAGFGDIHLDETGALRVKTGGGRIVVDRVLGQAEISAASAGVEIGSIEGSAVIKNASGEIWVGECGGDLVLKSATGGISVDRAGAAVEAKTARGGIRLGEVGHGSVDAATALGTVDVGIQDGVTAWLDLATRHGTVHNDLNAAQGPEAGAETVRVRAQTAIGDIIIRRCSVGSISA